MKSVWNNDRTSYAPLGTNRDCDVVVIGGGITGFLAAYEVQRRGKKVILLESKSLFSGTTSGTTAKISAMQGAVYSKLIKKYGVVFARDYYDSQMAALRSYKSLITEKDIDCSFENQDAYLYSLTPQNSHKVEEELRAYQTMGIPAKKVERLEYLPIEIDSALCLPKQGQFNPLQFLCSLERNFEIYENSLVTKIDDGYVEVNGYIVQAESIIIATQFPIKNYPGFYFMKLHPSTSYTCAFQHPEPFLGQYLDVEDSGYSFRKYQEYLLMGGLDHRTGRIDAAYKFQKIKEDYRRIFSDQEPEYSWFEEDMMTFDGIPYIGNFSGRRSKVFVATGFNKWGMSNSMLASKILADKIESRTNQFEYIFSPQRMRIGKFIGPFLKNAMTNTKYISKNYFPKLKKSIETIPINCGMITNIDGKKVAIYRDEKNQLHRCCPTCEHLHSSLVWNPNTRTWDCPCHGSRYDVDGNILHGPAIEKNKIRDKYK